MPKATLSFDLSDPWEKEQHAFLNKATDFYLAIHDLDAWLRSNVKYGAGDDFEGMDKDTVEKILSLVRDRLYSYLNERDTSLDMLS